MDDAIGHFNEFGKINADEMFEQIDKNSNGLIEPEEWDEFWMNVIRCGHSEEYISGEIDNILGGGSWCKFDNIEFTYVKKNSKTRIEGKV